MAKKIHRNRSILHDFQDTSIFVCCYFCKKFENSKWPPFFGETEFFFENWVDYSSEIPYGSKISSKSLYLARFSSYNHFCVLQDVRNFPFPAKVQDGRPKLQTLNILILGI